MTSSPIPNFQSREQIESLLAGRKNYRDEVKAITERYRYVVFYGCGAILNSIVETWMEQVGRPLDFTCDSNPEKWGKIFCGAKCLSPQELLAIKDQCAIFVTVGQFKPVFESLLKAGCPSVNLVYKYDLATSAYLDTHAPAEIATNLWRTRQWLSDRRSVEAFDAIVNRVLSAGRGPELMTSVCDGHQYFPADVIKLTECERLVDIGAFNGDTVKDFVERTSAKFDRIFCFEVDRMNFAALKENAARLPNADRIKVFNVGIWDSECDITYSIGQSQSTVGAGTEKGHVVPLDQVLQGEKVSMIKMDIEGAEVRALHGAKSIIQHQKPRMAICVYHDFTHLWAVPSYLKKLVPEYKIYMRHHTNLEYETVCYATI